MPTTNNLVSSSRREYIYAGEEIKCGCNRLAPRETSWSDLHPGGRFYACSEYRVGGCGFFRWYDKVPFPARANIVLLELRDRERHLTRQNLALKKELMKYSTGIGCNDSAKICSSVNSSVRSENAVDGTMKKNKWKNKFNTMKKQKDFYKLLFMLALMYIVIGHFVSK